MAMDASPVETLEQALWWLLKNLTDEELKSLVAGAAQLPRCAKLVCDIYWVTEKQLRDYIAKKHREIGNV